MDVVRYQPFHYAQLKMFWERYGWTAPSQDVLPRNGFVAVSSSEHVVGAAFVYLSEESMALLDWVIVDPDALEISRGRAVHKTVQACKALAIKEGKKILYTVTANQALLRSYKRMGFNDMENNATTMAISLDGSKTDFLR